MATFTLDTSGFVKNARKSSPHSYQWSALSPFCQGYVEAAFSGTWELDSEGLERPLTHFAGFSDLDAATLAQMIADCEAYKKHSRADWITEADGRAFWGHRQRNWLVSLGFPPLDLSLSETGKVIARESDSTSTPQQP